MFYALSSDGDIIIIKAQTKNKNQVVWEEAGRIITNSWDNTDIVILQKKIITYSNNTETLQVFNITQESEKELKYNKISGVALKINFHNFGKIKGNCTSI